MSIFGEEDIGIAFRFLEAVETGLDLISEHPYVGAELDLQSRELEGVRIWPVIGFEKYLIFYFLVDNAVDVVRVLNTSRDIRGMYE